MNPKLKFQLNIELDIHTCTQFLGYSKAGIDFGAGIIKLYPELAKTQNVREFVEKFYQNHKQELDEALIKIQSDWEKVENDFFKATDKVFENHSWPSGQYICYFSIFNCNPRFLNTKTFQAYYKNEVGINHLIAHEMLHFIFHDYAEQKVDKDKIWTLSEVFDNLAFEQPIFEKFKPKFQGSYPEIKNLENQLRDKLKNKLFTIKEFLTTARTIT